MRCDRCGGSEFYLGRDVNVSVAASGFLPSRLTASVSECRVCGQGTLTLSEPPTAGQVPESSTLTRRQMAATIVAGFCLSSRAEMEEIQETVKVAVKVTDCLLDELAKGR